VTGWPTVRLGEVIELKRGYDLPGSDREPGSHPVVSSSGVTGTHSHSKVAAPGVVTGRYGTIGQVFFLEQDFWPLNTTLYVRDFKGNDPQFVSYFLRTLDFHQFSDKAAVPGVNRNHVHEALVRFPPIDEQRAIASVLGAFDDKIELNRRMSETLEALARAIFTSWFVDFDPVRAKAEGRKPVGMGAETASLFPDSIEDSPLGPIPSGWTVQAIGDLFDVVGGSTPSTSEPTYWNGDIAFATPKDLAALTVPILTRTARRITRAGARQVSSGVLEPGVVVLSSRAPIGYLAITDVPVVVNQGFIGMKPTRGVPSIYGLMWAKHNMSRIVAAANGTTFLEISKRNFRPLPALSPPTPVLDAYLRITEPILLRMARCVHESDVLAAARDLLLPALVSGAVRVSRS
jgi:type I restriction enzyme, S subunit